MSNLTFQLKSGIITLQLMAHYSSQMLYQEDELKNSLYGISVKPLVFASYAQFGVDAGDEGYWATRNGIRTTFHYPWRPNLVGSLYETNQFLMTNYELGQNLYVAKVMYSVASLE